MKKLYETDPYLMPYKEAIKARHERIMGMKRHIAGDGLLKDAVNTTAPGSSASGPRTPPRSTWWAISTTGSGRTPTP